MSAGQPGVPRHVAVKILKDSINLLERKIKRGGRLGGSLDRLSKKHRDKAGAITPLAGLLHSLSEYLNSYQESDQRELEAYKLQLKSIESPIHIGGVQDIPPRNN